MNNAIAVLLVALAAFAGAYYYKVQGGHGVSLSKAPGSVGVTVK